VLDADFGYYHKVTLAKDVADFEAIQYNLWQLATALEFVTARPDRMRAARNGVLDTTAALDAFLQAATTTEWVMVDLYRVELVNLGAGLFPVTDSARGLVLLWADYPYAVRSRG